MTHYLFSTTFSPLLHSRGIKKQKEVAYVIFQTILYIYS